MNTKPPTIPIADMDAAKLAQARAEERERLRVAVVNLKRLAMQAEEQSHAAHIANHAAITAYDMVLALLEP